jgi:hypothetical protein
MDASDGMGMSRRILGGTLALALAACALPVDETADAETVVSLPEGSWQAMTVADGAAVLVDGGDDEPSRDRLRVVDLVYLDR